MPIERRWKPAVARMAKDGFHRAMRSTGCAQRASGEMAWATPTHAAGCFVDCPTGISASRANPYHVPRSQSASRPICSGVSSGSEPSAALPKLGIRSFVSP